MPDVRQKTSKLPSSDRFRAQRDGGNSGGDWWILEREVLG